jgi:hypothetical protein
MLVSETIENGRSLLREVERLASAPLHVEDADTAAVAIWPGTNPLIAWLLAWRQAETPLFATTAKTVSEDPSCILDSSLGLVLLPRDALGVDPQQYVDALTSLGGDLTRRWDSGIEPGGRGGAAKIVRDGEPGGI